MFSTSSIIDNLNQEEGLDYKKLCRLLKISKKSDKDKLDIALLALEKLAIINKNEENKYTNLKDSKHLVAKIRCSSKGYCFAVRENIKEVLKTDEDKRSFENIELDYDFSSFKEYESNINSIAYVIAYDVKWY